MTFEEFENIVRESLKDLDNYAYGEHDGFEIDEGFIIQTHISGGAEGGNCWGDEARYFSNNKQAEPFYPLDTILKTVNPEISYLKYKEIEGLIENGYKSIREYYGNYTEYDVYSLNIRALYDALFSND